MPRRPKTLLTVDWDAFIPVNKSGDPQLWDIGHAETNLHVNTLWQMRGGLVEHMQVDPALAKPFWAEMQRRFAPFTDYTLVSDSHMHVFGWLMDIQQVVLVDAHHDCWQGPKNAVDCSNWARVWLGKSRTKHLHWIVPDWVDITIYDEWKFVTKEKRVSIYKLSDILKGSHMNALPRTIDRVHVCRSGCWTPPWLDQAFIDWLKAGGRDAWQFPLGEKGTNWDALRLRWDAEAYEAMYEAQRVMTRQLHAFNREGG